MSEKENRKDEASSHKINPKVKKQPRKKTATAKPYCGIIMPISAIDGCPEQHWNDIREIIEESINQADFEPRLVSDADEVGIIQKRIIQNVYDDPVVVCDVSGKNPNVMFELGMRLAFDKPTIIIKDDKTTYSFDTSPIEHLEYPRDLRFAKIVEFQQNLTGKIIATHKKSQTDKNYTTFLKHFGSFDVAKIETRTRNRDEIILEELQNVKSLLLRQSHRISETRNLSPYIETDKQNFMVGAIKRALNYIGNRKATTKRKDIRHLVLQYIIAHEEPAKYFANGQEFESFLDQYLSKMGK